MNADPDCHRVVYHRLTSGPVSVTSARRADTLMPSCIWVVDGLAGVSAPAEHVAIGFTGWRCQASPATQDGSPTSRRRSFYLFLMPDAFPLMPLTDAQAAVKAGEAVLAHYSVA